MRQPISFAKFLQLPKDVQESMGRLDNENLTEELSPTAKKKMMIDFERKLKGFDFWYAMGDHSAWKKGEKANAEIKKMMDVLGDDGKELYKMYAKKSNVQMREALKDPRPNAYEKHLHKKMKKWGITDLDQLTGEAKKRFHAELDAEAPDPDMKENKSIRNAFPEMDKVVRQGTLGYGDDRRVGEKSLTAGSFIEPGELYPDHLTPHWQPPSENRKRRMK